MSAVKQVSVSGVVAFGPRNLLAVGTAAGSIDPDFSNDSQLEIYGLDFRHAAKNLQRLGSAPSSDRFHRLSWGISRSEHFHEGIIAAGLANGSIEIWDPAKLAAGKGEAARITKLDKHKGPVKGLQFNPQSPHLLASAGADGELAIWDLSDPRQPKQYPPLKQGQQQGPKAEISNLAWNPNVAYILATCTTAGDVTICNLKKMAAVLSLVDEQGRMKSCSALAWNPLKGMHLVGACDHHLSPTLLRWDLQQPKSPFELLGHEQGVTSLSWCRHEPNYLLSASKDGKIMLWNASQGTVLGSFTAGPPGEYAHEILWSPYSPGLFAVATLGAPEGQNKVSLHTNKSFTEPAGPTEEGVPAAVPSPLLHAPEWMKRPAGACFGFGGKLAAFKNVKTETGQVKSVETSIRQVVTERALVEQSGALEQAVMSNDKAALADFCASKATKAAPEERESWAFMQMLFQNDSRRHLLEHLGFQDIMPKADGAGEDASLAAHAESLQLTSPRSAPGTSPPHHMPEANGNSFKEEDGESFFENLQQAEPQVSRTSTLSPRPVTSEEHHAEAGESEAEIQRALFVGNYEAAVNTCLQAERMADALVIASVGGTYLFEKAQKEYMRRAPRPYMKIVSAIMSRDLAGLVKSRPLDQWKETLALLCAYGEEGEFHALCDMLAKRLAGAGLHGPATLAWICAANVDKAVRQWTTDLKASSPEPSAEALQNLVERAVVLGHGANKEETSAALAALVNQYASILAAQGRMGAAQQYLSMVPGDAAPDVAELKDRIHRSGAPDVNVGPEPMFPFIAEDVPVDPSAVQQSSAYSQQAAYSQQSPYSQNTQAAPAAAAPTGTDYYSRNQYHVHGGYSKPSGPAYNNSGFSNPSYSNQQAPQQAGFGTGYDSSYSGGGYGQQQSAAYQPAPQPAPVAHFAPQSSGSMQPGSASYSSQMGGGYAPPRGPTPQAPAYSTQPSRAVPQPPQPSWQPQAAPAAPAQQAQPAWQPQAAPGPSAAQAQPAWQQPAPPAAQPAPVPRAASWQPQQAPEQQNVFAPMHAPSSGLAPVATQQAPPPAFVPRSSPAQTPSGYGQPTPFGQPAQPGPVTPPKPAPPPAPTGPPANVNIETDTSKVPAEYQAMVTALRELVRSIIANAGPSAGKKREAEDNSKKIGALFWRMNAGELKPEILDKLRALMSAIQSGNKDEASSIQMDITNNHWAETGPAMTALKRMIKQILR